MTSDTMLRNTYFAKFKWICQRNMNHNKYIGRKKKKDATKTNLIVTLSSMSLR